MIMLFRFELFGCVHNVSLVSVHIWGDISLDIYNRICVGTDSGLYLFSSGLSLICRDAGSFVHVA